MTRQVPPEVTERVREEARAFLRARPDLSITDLIHHTALSESTGRCFMNGHCAGGREVIGEITRALARARSGDILQPGGRQSIVITEQPEDRVRQVTKRHRFYETQTVKRVAEILDYCSDGAKIGVITGDFGVGKTDALNAWRMGRGQKVENLVFEFDDFAAASACDFVFTLVGLLGMTVSCPMQFAGPAFRDLCDHLRESPALLVFDQAEMVRARVFQTIRMLWDRTHEAGVGVVILAAPLLLVRLSRSGMADLGALTSRVGIWGALSGVTRNEMAAIVKAEGIADVDEDAFDLWWRATRGSMRRLMGAIDLLKARHAGRRVTATTITGVAGHLWGTTIQEKAWGRNKEEVLRGRQEPV